jgi:hypothetical protein
MFTVLYVYMDCCSLFKVIDFLKIDEFNIFLSLLVSFIECSITSFYSLLIKNLIKSAHDSIQ